jgi:glycerol-3-phosphate dehydrogenase
MQSSSQTVLILGAGINGVALARELALNDVSVWLVDTNDIASGATSGSSRLIHGGLRYLEYGEFDLVKESLAERTRLLKLAPQFVRPLRLWIPAENRLGGFIPAIGRFFNWSWWPQPKKPRGSELIRAGLIFYDAYAADVTVPRHTCGPANAPDAPAVNHELYRRLCSYYDGQVAYAERLVLSMLTDATEISRERGLDFRVLNYHQAQLVGDTVEIRPVDVFQQSHAAETLRPDLIVNATGAWVDETLQALHVPSERLMGGTKGSHLFSFSPRLKEQLAGQGIYAEASDGRPIFITPLADTVLIGTTDMPFEGDPRTAQATDGEIEYLIQSVNRILPGARLEPSDINFHYSAVRPLPYVHARTTGAITRRHFFVEHEHTPVPIFSVVGGKLTTMRALAEQAAADVLQHFGKQATATSRDRLFPGAEDYPSSPAAVAAAQDAIARRTDYSPASVAATWALYGTRCEAILTSDANAGERRLLPDTELPEAIVRWSIREEQVHTIADLVERRLMLLYHERLSERCLRRLANLLAEAARLPTDGIDAAVTRERQRLHARFGKSIC